MKVLQNLGIYVLNFSTTIPKSFWYNPSLFLWINISTFIQFVSTSRKVCILILVVLDCIVDQKRSLPQYCLVDTVKDLSFRFGILFTHNPSIDGIGNLFCVPGQVFQHRNTPRFFFKSDSQANCTNSYPQTKWPRKQKV